MLNYVCALYISAVVICSGSNSVNTENEAELIVRRIQQNERIVSDYDSWIGMANTYDINTYSVAIELLRSATSLANSTQRAECIALTLLLADKGREKLGSNADHLDELFVKVAMHYLNSEPDRDRRDNVAGYLRAHFAGTQMMDYKEELESCLMKYPDREVLFLYGVLPWKMDTAANEFLRELQRVTQVLLEDDSIHHTLNPPYDSDYASIRALKGDSASQKVLEDLANQKTWPLKPFLGDQLGYVSTPEMTKFLFHGLRSEEVVPLVTDVDLKRDIYAKSLCTILKSNDDFPKDICHVSGRADLTSLEQWCVNKLNLTPPPRPIKEYDEIMRVFVAEEKQRFMERGIDIEQKARMIRETPSD